MHHNENCQRDVKLKKTGEKYRGVVRSKAKKQNPTIAYRREDATYGEI